MMRCSDGKLFSAPQIAPHYRVCEREKKRPEVNEPNFPSFVHWNAPKRRERKKEKSEYTHRGAHKKMNVYICIYSSASRRKKMFGVGFLKEEISSNSERNKLRENQNRENGRARKKFTTHV
jgi:hypothetical protein